MQWHTISSNEDLKEANKFEANILKEYGLITEIAPRYKLLTLLIFLVDILQDIIVMFILLYLILMDLKHLKRLEMSSTLNLLKN